MKIIAISDTHNHHNDIILPPGDILIHCGDFTNSGTMEEIDDFSNWYTKQPHKLKILVFGNHDISTDNKFYDKNWKKFHDKKVTLCKDYWKNKDIIVLEGEIVEYENMKIWGHPALPPTLNKIDAWHSDTFMDSNEIWDKVPNDIDIIITHSPPFGILDKTPNSGYIGNEEMLVHIHDRINPLICIFGHVHKPGFLMDDNGTRYYNVSVCDSSAMGPSLIYKPTVIDI